MVSEEKRHATTECMKLWHEYRAFFNEPLNPGLTAVVVCFDESTWVLAAVQEEFFLVELSTYQYHGAIEKVLWPTNLPAIVNALETSRTRRVYSRDEAIYRRRIMLTTHSCRGRRVLGRLGESRVMSCGRCFICSKDDHLVRIVEDLGIGQVSKAQALAIKNGAIF